MSSFSNIVESLRKWWQNATGTARAASVGGAVMLLIGLTAAGMMATSPNYKVVFSGVSGEDAEKIQTVLHEHNIDMVWSASDQNLKVPAKDADAATMAVESAGVLSPEAKLAGVDPLDKIGFATSTAVERERIRETSEHSIEQLLNGIDHVDSAMVKISDPTSATIFAPEQSPQASVTLNVRPGESLDPQQVLGIVNLVAHGLGIPTKNVALTDQSGAELWQDNGAGGNSIGDGQPQQANLRYSDALRTTIQNTLDSVYGRGKVMLTVHSELDPNTSSTHTIEYSPSAGGRTGLPTVEHTSDTSYTGSAPPATAPAGASSNLAVPTYSASTGGSPGNMKQSDSNTTYANNVSEVTTTGVPGKVLRLTVAAMVDTKIPATDLPAIKDVISQAIGATPGDTTRLVTVDQVSFDGTAAKLADDMRKSASSQQLMDNIVRGLIVAGVAGLLLFMMTRGSRRGAPQLALSGNGSNIGLLDDFDDSRLNMLIEEQPLRVEDVLSEMPEAAPRPRKRRLQAPSIEEHQDLKMESIQDMVTNNSESVALLLKGWMAEEAR